VDSTFSVAMVATSCARCDHGDLSSRQPEKRAEAMAEAIVDRHGEAP
jgi:hypothetical protein